MWLSPPHTGPEDEVPWIRNADLRLKSWLLLLRPLLLWGHWEWPRWDVVLLGTGSRDSLQVRQRDGQHLSSETPASRRLLGLVMGVGDRCLLSCAGTAGPQEGGQEPQIDNPLLQSSHPGPPRAPPPGVERGAAGGEQSGFRSHRALGALSWAQVSTSVATTPASDKYLTGPQASGELCPHRHGCCPPRRLSEPLLHGWQRPCHLLTSDYCPVASSGLFQCHSRFLRAHM